MNKRRDYSLSRQQRRAVDAMRHKSGVAFIEPTDDGGVVIEQTRLVIVRRDGRVEDFVEARHAQ